MGIFGHFNLEIDGITAISPIVIMTLAVADSVHVIAGMYNGMRNGLAKSEAIVYSLRLNFAPVFLTSLTTALGVITFSFSDFPPLRKLGLIIALGVTVAFVLSVTLPAGRIVDAAHQDIEAEHKRGRAKDLSPLQRLGHSSTTNVF